VGGLLNQDEARELLATIYTQEKKAIWNKEMDLLAEKWNNDEIDFIEYMNGRNELRKKLGFP